MQYVRNKLANNGYRYSATNQYSGEDLSQKNSILALKSELTHSKNLWFLYFSFFNVTGIHFKEIYP
jgi:hypothetical protein